LAKAYIHLAQRNGEGGGQHPGPHDPWQAAPADGDFNMTFAQDADFSDLGSLLSGELELGQFFSMSGMERTDDRSQF